MSALKPKSSGGGSRKDRNPRLRRSSTTGRSSPRNARTARNSADDPSAAAPQLKNSTIRCYRRKQRTHGIQTEAATDDGQPTTTPGVRRQRSGSGLRRSAFHVRRCCLCTVKADGASTTDHSPGLSTIALTPLVSPPSLCCRQAERTNVQELGKINVIACRACCSVCVGAPFPAGLDQSS